MNASRCYSLIQVIVMLHEWMWARRRTPTPTYLKSQVVSLQTAHSWANAGVLLGDACIGSGVAFEAIKLLG